MDGIEEMKRIEAAVKYFDDYGLKAFMLFKIRITINKRPWYHIELNGSILAI